MLDTIKSKLKHFWYLFSEDMAFNKKMHGWMTVVWGAAAIPIAIFLNSSVPFLVFISVYAVVGFHWNIWFNTKIEKRHEDHPVAEEIMEKLDKETDVEVNSTTTKEEVTITSEK
ncbi:membrane protein [Arthrobacter phage Racecar]|nr:hypothetical protein PBI_RACECAR_226 [Arthrobacter phage Racecar]